MESILLFAGFIVCQGLIFLGLFIAIRVDKKRERIKAQIEAQARNI